MEKIEKIKIAVDVSLYYFIITTLLSALGKIIPNFFLKNMEVTKSLGFSLPWFIISSAVILILLGISNMLKSNLQVQCNPYNKTLASVIVGILLVGSGVIGIPTQVYAFMSYLKNVSLIDNDLSQFNKEKLEIGKYTYIVPILCLAIQIATGLFLAIVNSNVNKKQIIKP